MVFYNVNDKCWYNKDSELLADGIDEQVLLTAHQLRKEVPYSREARLISARLRNGLPKTWRGTDAILPTNNTQEEDR